MELKVIPRTVQKALMPKSVHPIAPLIMVKQMGVYVPKISKNIEQWSNILKTDFAVTLVSEWYKEENVYKSISDAPYIHAPTTPIAVPWNEVAVETVETLESGLVFINGGMENGGYDLWHNDSGVYFEHGYNDAKSYYALGEATIRVSTEFEFVDSSDLDKGEVTYYPGDFLTDNAGILYHFVPNNTSIVVEGGQIIQMTRIYTP